MANDKIEKAKIEEIELTEEENKGQLRAYEDDILKGLLAAANFKTEEDNIQTIEIARNGVVLFTVPHPSFDRGRVPAMQREVHEIRQEQATRD